MPQCNTNGITRNTATAKNFYINYCFLAKYYVLESFPKIYLTNYMHLELDFLFVFFWYALATFTMQYQKIVSLLVVLGSFLI